jgi:hypothetical protein
MRFHRIAATLGVAVALVVLPASAVAQTLPGTTIGQNCPTTYREIDQFPQTIRYLSCKDGTTVKITSYVEPNGDGFSYFEWRDPSGQLYGTRFVRYPAAGGSQALADSATP